MSQKPFPFEVDESSDVPLWAQLRQRLIFLITSGYFKPGDKLPTVRGLASDISINYNTVNKAYLSLVSEGYLESTRGRGVFVRDLDAQVEEGFAHEVEEIVDDCIAACRDRGLSLDDVQAHVVRRVRELKKEERGDGRAADDSVSPHGNVVDFDALKSVSARRA